MGHLKYMETKIFLILFFLLGLLACTSQKSGEQQEAETQDEELAVLHTFNSEDWYPLFQLFIKEFHLKISSEELEASKNTFEYIDEGDAAGARLSNFKAGSISIWQNQRFHFYENDGYRSIDLCPIPKSNEVAVYYVDGEHSELRFYRYDLEKATLNLIPQNERLTDISVSDFLMPDTPADALKYFNLRYNPMPEGIQIEIFTKNVGPEDLPVGDYQLYEKKLAVWNGTQYVPKGIPDYLSIEEKAFAASCHFLFGLSERGD